MTITDNVIRDLLPLYVTGEASPDTRALVEEYLAKHPDLRAEALPLGDPLLLPDVEPPPGLETRALEETRTWIGRRQTLFGWALGLSFLIFSFRFKGGEMVQLLYRDFPLVAAALLGASLIAWGAFLHACRRLAGVGMEPPSRWLWILFGAIATAPFSFFLTVQFREDLVRDLLPVGGFIGLALRQWVAREKRP